MSNLTIVGAKVFRVGPYVLSEWLPALRARTITSNLLGCSSSKAGVLEVDDEQFAALDAGKQSGRITKIRDGIENLNVKPTRQRRKPAVTSHKARLHCTL